MACPNCGGGLETIDEATGHYVCDTCDYEVNEHGIIDSGAGSWESINRRYGI